MKMAKRIMAVIAMVIAISTNIANATDAETPIQEYVRNGITYRMYSVAMEEVLPEYNQFLEQLAVQLFQEESPMIYGYYIDYKLDALNGFKKTYKDNSKAIYINQSQSFRSGTQVFIHEMVHCKYDVPDAILYQRDSEGLLMYRDLVEALTDIIAEKKYALISKNEYEKAYPSIVLDEMPKEDIELLLKLYKGELTVKGVEMYLQKLNTAIELADIDETKEVVFKIKSIAERGE